jgi:hypothetical protein
MEPIEEIDDQPVKQQYINAAEREVCQVVFPGIVPED